MKAKVSYKNLPSKCKCGQWDINPNDYEYNPFAGILVHDIPPCKSAKKFNTLGLGEACFDGIEGQGFGVKHYVDYAEGFGTSEGTLQYIGFEDGTMSSLLDLVTNCNEIYLHFEWIGCKCK